MIIDSHTHIGNIGFRVGKNRVNRLPEEDLIVAMDKYKIDFALVSSIDGSEFDSDSRLASKDMQVTQAEGLGRILRFVRGNIAKVKGLFWIKPYTESLSPEIEKSLTENRDLICGLKVHPTLSNLKFTDRRFYPYLELAVKLGLPVQVHTENDGRSDVKFVGKMASIFPELKFVMVHMGMNSNNSEAISLIANSNNIFGDTCVVGHENVIKAIRDCGSDKILFGTDAVVNGVDTYKRYLPLIEKIWETFPAREADKVMAMNCKTIFDLNNENLNR